MLRAINNQQHVIECQHKAGYYSAQVFRHIARWGSMKRRCRSRQVNTHNTEFREVYYPWHPWFGRTVAVYEVLVKQGESVCRCGSRIRQSSRGIGEGAGSSP